jgi:2-polyprenyl-3-methyl-5-hydroxy-6-metoxy-1,4-benzoquinol methylase
MLEERSEEMEIMDDLSVSGEVVNQTLRELNTINKYLGGNRISLSAFKKLALEQKHIRLADLGCGGGDIMKDMAKWCRKKSLPATFVGIDANPNIISYAHQNTKDYPEISYQTINIFSDTFLSQKFDIIHCCLFLHHFTNDQLIALFRQFKKQARRVIVNDLHRHLLAYGSIKLLTSIFSKSDMVKNDACVSVARGFKRQELEQILKSAGIDGYTLQWKWAFRWQLIF